MRRILVSALLLIAFLSFFVGCDNVEDEYKEALELIEYNAALELIENEDYEGAYKLLYSIKENEKAGDLLKSFKVEYTKLKTKGLGDDMYSESQYDENGRMIYNEVSTSEGLRYWGSYTYTYHPNGKVSTCKYTGNSYKFENYTTTTEYNTDGDIIKETTVTLEGDTTLVVYSYFGDMVVKETSVNGSITKSEELTYDLNGNLLMSKTTEKDGYTRTEQNTYDEYNNVLKTVVSNSDGYTNTDEYVYTYDDDGKVLRCVRTDSRGFVFIDEYSYDDYGNRVKWIFTVMGGSSVHEYSSFKYFYCPEE